MGFFSPFFFWPLASGNNSKLHAPRNSWTPVNREQGNGVDHGPQNTTHNSMERDSNDTTGDQTSEHAHIASKATAAVVPHDCLDHERSIPGEFPINRRQSWRGSNRLSGIKKTLLRSRKEGQRQCTSDTSNTSNQLDTRIDGAAAEDKSHDTVLEAVFSGTRESQYADSPEVPQTDQPYVQQPEDFDTRKVSEQTVHSLNSESTTSTVCHHPSKRPTDPTALENRGYVYENPFGDLLESSGTKTFIDDAPNPNTCPKGQSISENHDASSQPYLEQQDPPLAQRRSEESPRKSSIFRNISTTSNESIWSAQIDQGEAIKSFNGIAAQLCLNPVSTKGGKPRKADAVPEKKLRKRNRIIGRMRTMRSNVQIKSPSMPPEPEQPRLRRMKTFANLSSRSDPFVALKGKSLETLARLGGFSLLKLPKEFAPAILKLPVCFAATAAYLRRYASDVQNLFFDPGDFKAAARTYDHFANQVLLAEREEDKIQTTTRSSQMPLDLVEVLQLDAPFQKPSHVLSVAWVFKALLAGIPDGILGSGALYQVLVDISYGRPSPDYHEPEAKRPDSCLEGLTPWEHVMTKTIALAMLGLTSKMHMELICGVFGLCELLLHESYRTIETEWLTSVRNRERRPSWAADLLDVDHLSRTLGPLLTTRIPDEDLCGEALREERVVRMLLEYWHGVNRQLLWWEHCGWPPERVALQESAK